MATTKVLLGTLAAGLAAGALAGILFARNKGSVTRKKIYRKSSAFADELKENFNDFVDDVSDKLRNISNPTDSFKAVSEHGKHKTNGQRA